MEKINTVEPRTAESLHLLYLSFPNAPRQRVVHEVMVLGSLRDKNQVAKYVIVAWNSCSIDKRARL